MPIDPAWLQTGGALQGAVAASLLREHDARAEPAAGTVIGHYRLLRELGRGGMAIVYLAERDDGEYRQQVALKWMPATHAQAMGETLFRRERQALADLRHPHIARLLDGGRSQDGRPWLAMEYIDGLPLDRHCQRHRLPLDARIEILLHVCAAVAFAHAYGVIHRDIKPSNVLVDIDGNARLLDFGIAQWLGQDDTLASGAFTPGYASPEQQRGDTPTVATDIYQLGRLLSALLDDAPRSRDNAGHAEACPRTQAGSNQPSGPASLRADLKAIRDMACREDPATRHATVEALAADLRASLAQRPVSARPRTMAYLANRFLRRHPRAVAATAAGLVLAIAAGSAFVWRLQAERDAADHQARIATAVLDFLREDVLAAADPATAPGQELTVRAALDMASSSVEARFGTLPIEAAAIRETLSALYLELGRLEEAEREARQAITATDSEKMPRALHNATHLSLAWALIGRDKLAEAETLLEKLQHPQEPAQAPPLRTALVLRNAKAIILHRRGEYEAARALHQDTLALASGQLGADDPLTLDLASRLAVDLQMLGRQDEALATLQRVHARRSSTLGASHPLTLAAAHDLGVLLRHRGESQAAQTLLAATLTQRRDILGHAHPQTLSTANELATVYQDQKRHAEAEALFQQVYDLRLQTLGEDHIYTRNSMSNLGLIHSLQGHLQEAEALYTRALARERRLMGEDHPDTIALMHNMAGLYRRQGRLTQALAMHERVLAAATASADLGPQAWQTALFRAGFAQTLHQAGRQQDAEAAMAASILTLERSLGPRHARTERARQMLAEFRAKATPL